MKDTNVSKINNLDKGKLLDSDNLDMLRLKALDVASLISKLKVEAGLKLKDGFDFPQTTRADETKAKPLIKLK